MEQGPRKATDVLLDVESKVSMLLDIIRAQDFNIKILSNKLNDIISKLDKQQAGPPKIVVEAVQTSSTKPATIPTFFDQLPAGEAERTIPISSETTLLQESSPQGFRRNSRPETYASDDGRLNNSKMPMQITKQPSNQVNTPPPGRSSEVVLPFSSVGKNGALLPPMQQSSFNTQPQPMPQGQIPVMQRVVDKNGKSIFLADVDIMDLSTNQPVFKTRTNGTGKWMAALSVGIYKVYVRKKGSLSDAKEKIEAVQDITIDGNESKIDLPMLIIK